jgi:2-methylcitrate dehydratase PrpD
MNALGLLSRWAAGSDRDSGPVAIARAHAAYIDTLGCMLAGAAEEAARRVRATISPWGEGASIIVADRAAPAPWAALANGTAAHALDFDDNDIPAASHPSSVLFSAILALAAPAGRRLGEVLDAYIVGLEVMARVGEAVNMGHYARGWHATVTIGSLGAAAACARLLRLDAAQLSDAISIATSSASGFQCQFGTMTKPLHAGLAAKTGLIAASLAAAGLRGSADALDGEAGFSTLLADADAPGFSGLSHRLGNPLAIIHYGLSVKRYPCCYYLARSLDAALELRAANGIRASDITAVTVAMRDRNARVLRYPRPRTIDEARFSANYCVAVALERGALRLSDFRPGALEREATLALMSRIRLEPYAARGDFADLSAEEPDTVTVQLASGEKFSRTVASAYGSARAPLSRADLLDKFRDCAQVSLPPDRIDAALARVSDPDLARPVSDLMQMLARHPSGSGEPAAG